MKEITSSHTNVNVTATSHVKKKTFLVEIGTEELPSKRLRTLAEDFSSNIMDELDNLSIQHGKVNWFATPRRLAVKVTSVNCVQNEKKIEEIGPSIKKSFNSFGKPTKIAHHWARKMGITVDQAERLVRDKGEWLVYRTLIKGLPVKRLLCDIINNAITKLQATKMMRWGDQNIQFIRPIRTVTLLFDEQSIPGNVLGVNIDRMIRGHRFMGESDIRLDHADSYPEILLKRGKVIADYELRKKIIIHNVKEAAHHIGGVPDLDDVLLEEVTSLVEWPVILTGHFEEKYLNIPDEALVYTMKHDQKYFPVYDQSGKLLPYFIFISNILTKNLNKIISGNEKVVRARLSDAEFFFNMDKKNRLEDHLPRLRNMLFHNKLGSLQERSHRMKLLSGWIADQIGADVQQAKDAGLLSKCDLMTNMVFEFPNIQGVIGMHYARRDGWQEDVALAQKEQYQPRFSGDKLPTTLVSCAVAIADKMDCLAGIFGIGQCPKGNRDPFALRRSALGVLRIIVEKHFSLDLKMLTEEATYLYAARLTNTEVVDDIVNFMFNRFLAWYLEKGERIDTIQAVLAIRPTCPMDFDKRVRAIHYFRKLEESSDLTEVNKRVSNILDKSEETLNQEIQLALLKEPAEIQLANNVIVLRDTLKLLFKEGRYQESLVKLASLRDPVDLFFKEVMIMVKDNHIRINRLTLLNHLRALFLQIADISLLQTID